MSKHVFKTRSCFFVAGRTSCDVRGGSLLGPEALFLLNEQNDNSDLLGLQYKLNQLLISMLVSSTY